MGARRFAGRLREQSWFHLGKRMGRPTVTKLYPVSDCCDSGELVPFGQWEQDKNNGHLSHQGILWLVVAGGNLSSAMGWVWLLAGRGVGIPAMVGAVSREDYGTSRLGTARDRWSRYCVL